MSSPAALPAVVQPEMITPGEADLLAAFADFLRLDVAQGDASPETIRAYAGQVQAFVTWCQAQEIRPAAAQAPGPWCETGCAGRRASPRRRRSAARRSRRRNTRR